MKKLYSTDSNAGKLYSTGNVHKVNKNWTINDLPIRPMVLNVGTASYQLVKYLAHILLLLTHSPTDNFGPSIPVSDWFLFCRENLILIKKKKEMKMIKTQILWWKRTKKSQKSTLYSEHTKPE